MHQTVKVDEVVELACQVLPSPSDEDRVVMREWVYWAMKEIGPVGVNRIVDHNIPVNDFVIYKPDNCLYVEDMALLTADLTEVAYVLDGKGNAIHDHSSAVWNHIHVSESPTYYSLSNNADGIKWCKLKYLGLPLDENDLPMVPDRAVYAVSIFLRYLWHARHGNDAVSFENEKLWKREKIRTTASMKTPDKLTQREFGKRWLSMIDRAMDKVKYQN